MGGPDPVSMQSYTPDSAPDPEDWLAHDEADRLRLVMAFHDQHGIPVANARLHAAIHAVVENQVAIEEAVVVETMARLQREGLSRHDAIHAVGGVLTDHLLAALRAKATAVELARGYLDDLRTLSAEGWRRG